LKELRKNLTSEDFVHLTVTNQMFMQELENRLQENPNSFDADSKLIVQRYVNEGKVEYLA